MPSRNNKDAPSPHVKFTPAPTVTVHFTNIEGEVVRSETLNRKERRRRKIYRRR